MIDGYTTTDLIFTWKYEDPLKIKENLELPEFAIVGAVTGGCTKSFSTGIFRLFFLCFCLIL